MALDMDGVDRGTGTSRPGNDRDGGSKRKKKNADSQRPNDGGLKPETPAPPKNKDKKNQGNKSEIDDMAESLAPFLVSGRQKHKGRPVLLGLSDDVPTARVILLGG